MYAAAPLENNMFEWHFTIRGPTQTEFEGGIYHGKITLPNDYPFAPPSIYFFTPNGRFALNTKICLSISAYHPESWQPAWGIRLMLEALISFLPTKGEGAVGALDFSKEERKKLAIESQNFKCPLCGPIKPLIPETSSEGAAERSAKYISEISGMHIHGMNPNTPSKTDDHKSTSSTVSSTPSTVKSEESLTTSIHNNEISSSLLSLSSTSSTTQNPIITSSTEIISETQSNELSLPSKVNEKTSYTIKQGSSSSSSHHHHNNKHKHHSSSHSHKHRHKSSHAKYRSSSSEEEEEEETDSVYTSDEDEEDIVLPSKESKNNYKVKSAKSTSTAPSTTTFASPTSPSSSSSISTQIPVTDIQNTANLFTGNHMGPLPVHPIPAHVPLQPEIIQQRVQQMQYNVIHVNRPPLIDSAIDQFMTMISLMIMILVFRKMFGLQLPSSTGSSNPEL